MKIEHQVAQMTFDGEDGTMLTLDTLAPKACDDTISMRLSEDGTTLKLDFDQHDAARLRTFLRTYLTGGRHAQRNPDIKPVMFYGERGATLEFCYDNRGEPYRQGVRITVSLTGKPGEDFVSAFFEEREVAALSEAITLPGEAG